jgi:hypothetical protein
MEEEHDARYKDVRRANNVAREDVLNMEAEHDAK